MHLIYVDESGNTGLNFSDSEQPVFLLAALIVEETCWLELENDLETELRNLCPAIAAADGEIHATELRSGRGQFKGVSVDDRVAIRDRWLQVANKHKLKLVYRSLAKRRFHSWLVSTFGTGVTINPHVAAFALVARVVNEYLVALGPKELGMFISDENKEIVRDVEKSIKVLRRKDGALQLTRIVEKGFFIDSAKSRILQLCDLCALSARKKEERKEGLPAHSVDDTGIKLIEEMIHLGDDNLVDILAWLQEGQHDLCK
jgi:hypothetical protein